MKTPVSYNFATIGGNLRQLRLRCGYTLQGIAQYLGVSYQQVQKYEAGRNRISVEHIYALRQLYDVPYDCFFEGLKTRPGPVNKTDEYLRATLLRLTRSKSKALKRKAAAIINVLMS